MRGLQQPLGVRTLLYVRPGIGALATAHVGLGLPVVMPFVGSLEGTSVL
jgi:hypothetical protein